MKLPVFVLSFLRWILVNPCVLMAANPRRRTITDESISVHSQRQSRSTPRLPYGSRRTRRNVVESPVPSPLSLGGQSSVSDAGALIDIPLGARKRSYHAAHASSPVPVSLDHRPTKRPRGRQSAQQQQTTTPQPVLSLSQPSTQPMIHSQSRRRVMRMTTHAPSGGPMIGISPAGTLTTSESLSDGERSPSELTRAEIEYGMRTPVRRPRTSSLEESPVSVTQTGVSPYLSRIQISSETDEQAPIPPLPLPPKALFQDPPSI